MAPMKRIRAPMHRYGEADFDADYLQWGFHDSATQVEEAESVLRIVGGTEPLHILDLACGIGTHAIHWAKKGHIVTAVDLSETFIAQAKQAMQKENVTVEFTVADIKMLPCCGLYDLVTWIEIPFFDLEIVEKIAKVTASQGYFIFDARNPENPKSQFRGSNWRTWREEKGVFYLERHETNPDAGTREDVWITIDPQREIIEEKMNSTPCPLTLQQKVKVLKKCGFKTVELRTMQGDLFSGGSDPYWLWVVGRKQGNDSMHPPRKQH
jgi:SAM-dependent methyltransferase